MPEPDTRQRILDTAERLFAAQGVHSTSLRQITGEAGVNLAAVNYHFRTKEGLLEAVIDRRLLPLNRQREERLLAVRRAAQEGGRRPRVEDTLLAFIEPMFRLLETEPGGRHFALLIGRALVEPDDTIRALFLRSVGPLVHLLFETLCACLPDQDRDLIFWRLQFVLGAVGHTLRWHHQFDQLGDAVGLPTGVHSRPEDGTTLRRLTAFLTAGLESP